MPDTKVYKAGETVTATLTLEPAHEFPTEVWVTLDYQPEPGAPPPRANRIAYLTLQTAKTPPPPATSEPLTFTVQTVVPKHIVGGVYKPSSVLFFMPDGSQRQLPDPDPAGGFVRHVADDPPVAFDTPVIKSLA